MSAVKVLRGKGMSSRQNVSRTKYTRGEVSEEDEIPMRQYIDGTNCPWGEHWASSTFRPNVIGRAVHGTSCNGTS